MTDELHPADSRQTPSLLVLLLATIVALGVLAFGVLAWSAGVDRLSSVSDPIWASRVASPSPEAPMSRIGS